MNLYDLRQRDIKHLWHPYTEITDFESSEFPVIERAQGLKLYQMDGPELLDGISSWWCVNLGHSHPRLVDAIQSQAAKLQNVILGGMSHVSAIELAEKIAQLTPGNLNHVFFASDGASAVEAALKIALQYWVNIGESGRTRFICLKDGYHGDTLGAMGVGYVETFHKDFKEVIPEAYRAVSPHCAQCPFDKHPDSCGIECFESMETLIKMHHETTAAVIVEPLCQGAAGIRIYPEEYLRRLKKLCDEFGLLLIADEIAVGFGRTGSMFACEKAGIEPDIITIGKGLTGGYLPMSAAVVSSTIYDSFRREGHRIRTLYHGHTYCGNPITSALALAALHVYEDEKILSRILGLSELLSKGIKRLSKMLSDSFGRTSGLIGVVELNVASGGAERARRIGSKAMELGLFIRPLGRSVYLWPPLISSADDIETMLDILAASVQKTAN